MREKPVISHTDAQASRDPPQKSGYEESFPSEKEEGCYGPGVKQGHECGCDPVDLAVGGGFTVESFKFHLAGFLVLDARIP
jgi:hypothetical protein